MSTRDIVGAIVHTEDTILAQYNLILASLSLGVYNQTAYHVREHKDGDF